MFFLKKVIKQYMHLSALERRGSIVLLCVCCVLVMLWFYFAGRTSPATTNEIAAYQQAAANFLQHHTTRQKDSVKHRTKAADIKLFAFDPNTLDSTGFISLGLEPHTVHLLLNWRRKGKHFNAAEDMKPLYTLKAKDYNRLKPYIEIKR